MWNVKESLIRAGIFGGIAFLVALQVAGDKLFTDPKLVIIPAAITGGIAFLTSLKDTLPPMPTPP